MTSSSPQPVRGIEVGFTVHGAGPRVVLIHGLGQDRGIWAGIQHALSDHETLAYDLRGHGATPLGSGAGTIEQLGEDLVGLLEWFGAATVLGFSLGGVVALWAAAERPDLVPSVIAVATSSVVGSAAAHGLDERIALFERGDRAAIERQLLQDTRTQLGDPAIDAEAVAAARAGAVADPAGYINAARAVRRMRDEPLNARLEAIAQPVLIVGGERDVWCPRRAAEIMLDHLPDARFVELEGAGHLMTEDAPQRLTEVVRDWLRRRESHE